MRDWILNVKKGKLRLEPMSEKWLREFAEEKKGDSWDSDARFKRRNKK